MEATPRPRREYSVEATPRPRREYSVETRRGDVDVRSRRRGCVETGVRLRYYSIEAGFESTSDEVIVGLGQRSFVGPAGCVGGKHCGQWKLNQKNFTWPLGMTKYQISIPFYVSSRRYARPRRTSSSLRNPISAVAASTEYPRRGRGAAATRLPRKRPPRNNASTSQVRIPLERAGRRGGGGPRKLDELELDRAAADRLLGDGAAGRGRLPGDRQPVLSRRKSSKDGSRRHRGCDVNIPWSDVAATPRL